MEETCQMIDLECIWKSYDIRNPEYHFRKNRDAKKFIQIDALKDIYLKINKREVFGLLGPNGAGKTTLIKIISGLLMPNKGKGNINGFDLFKEREQVRTSINLLRSGDWVIFDYKLSLVHNLRYWGSVMGVPWKGLDEMIEEVLTGLDLHTKRNEFPESLSAGMRQKLSLARCMLTNRPIYLLDEPTSNIDPISANFIRLFARHGLAKMGKTVVLATNNLWEAEMICDKIMVINEGKTVIQGPKDLIKEKKGEEYALLSVEVMSDTLVQKLDSLPFVEKVNPLVVTNSLAEVHHLQVFGEIKMNLQEVILAASAETNVVRVELKEPTLNDIFFRLMEVAPK
jgi:ABC-2 type transport system ATP-binding protein